MSHSGYADLLSAHRTAVGTCVLVVDDAGLVLLVDDRLPGGSQRADESLSAAAARAVEGASGVRVEIVGLVGVYSDPADAWSEELAVCFRGRPVHGHLRANARWVEPERLDGVAVSAAARSLIAHGLTEGAGAYLG